MYSLEIQKSMQQINNIDDPEALPQPDEVSKMRYLWESTAKNQASKQPFLIIKHPTIELAELSPTTLRQTSAELVARNVSKSPVSEEDFDKMVEINMRIAGITPPVLSSKIVPSALLPTVMYESPADNSSTAGEAIAEDESSRMNLSEKLALFQKLTEKAKQSESRPPLSALQKKRQSDRAKTQPINLEDIRRASQVLEKTGKSLESDEMSTRVVSDMFTKLYKEEIQLVQENETGSENKQSDELCR